MKNIYKNLYSTKSRLNLRNIERIRIMREMITIEGNQTILDIGCYDGTFLSFFKKQTDNLYGIEASNYGLEKSREKGIKVKDFYFDDKSKIPFKSNSFDYIVAGEIIEHIYDTDFFLDEIYRLLKKDGFLILSTPNLVSLGRRLMLLMGRNPIIEVSPNEEDSSGHIRYFVKKTLFNLLNKHKFKAIEFKSDVINFNKSGSYKSKLLAKLFPTLGQSLIVKCKKIR